MAKRPSNAKKKAGEGAGAGEQYRPSADDILRFLSENPEQAGKREIAKAFGLKGGDKVWLRDTLRAMQDEGKIEKRRKRLAKSGEPPAVTVLRISGRDAQGGLVARFDQAADGMGDAKVSVGPPKRGGGGPVPGVGDRVLAKIFSNDEGEGYSARVMKLLERREEAVLGVVRRLDDGSYRLEPAQKRQPEFVLSADALEGAAPGDLVEVEPERLTRYGLPRGRVIAVVGPAIGEKAVSTIALHAHDIPHIFPSAVIEEAEAAKPVELGKREDWRHLPLVTIDPADAKDHDDAVWAEADADEGNAGGVVVYVAIADVAAYVVPGSPMDTEALNRGNSVYFPDRVVPMLPERISNDLCSLKEGVDRPALSFRMVFEASGRKRSHSCHRVLMRSRAKLSYQQAQQAVDGLPDTGVAADVLDGALKPLWAAYAVLKRGRDARQPLDLDLPERKILLKPDGTVDRVIVPERLDAHRLIEEFMIQANVAAAETLEGKRQALIYRVHDAPSLAKQESLREYLQTIGISLARGPALRPASFNTILEGVRGREHETLTNEVVLRSQSQAAYDPANIGHFGLNLRRYAHFTSPIRRYADLIVHRALIAALGLGAGGLTGDEEAGLERIASHISDTERRAMAAERETVDRLVAGYLSGRLNEVFDGRISGVTKAGLFVQLPQYGADGFVPVSTLGSDYFVFDEARRALIGQRSGLGFQLADPITVKLVEVAPVAGAMRFAVESEPKPLDGSGAKRSFHKGKRQQTRQRAVVGKAMRGRR